MPLPLAAASEAGADAALAKRCVLGGGDDYELLFAAPAARRADIESLSRALGIPLHRIGALTAEPGVLQLRERDGRLVPGARSGYDHFG